MCNYQQLHFDENTGYAIRCNKCKNIQVGLGNTILTLDTNAFIRFLEMLKMTASTIKEFPNNELKLIQISMPDFGFILLFSQKELLALIHMLDYADAELKYLLMMELFDFSDQA